MRQQIPIGLTKVLKNYKKTIWTNLQHLILSKVDEELDDDEIYEIFLEIAPFLPPSLLIIELLIQEISPEFFQRFLDKLKASIVCLVLGCTEVNDSHLSICSKYSKKKKSLKKVFYVWNGIFSKEWINVKNDRNNCLEYIGPYNNVAFKYF